MKKDKAFYRRIGSKGGKKINPGKGFGGVNENGESLAKLAALKRWDKEKNETKLFKETLQNPQSKG